MQQTQEKQQAKFDPNNLFDTLIERLGVKNDAELAGRLEVWPPVISKMRHLRMPVGATMMIRMHEETGMSIKELRRLMGDTQGLFRCGRDC